MPTSLARSEKLALDSIVTLDRFVK